MYKFNIQFKSSNGDGTGFFGVETLYANTPEEAKEKFLAKHPTRIPLKYEYILYSTTTVNGLFTNS